MYNYVTAFMVQFSIFMFGLIFTTFRLRAGGQTWDDLFPEKNLKYFVLTFTVVFWLGFGTWLRVYTQWPMMGIWEKILN